MHTVYIQTNDKQLLGALVAKFAIESHLSPLSKVEVHIMNVDKMDIFRNFHGIQYLQTNDEDMRTYDKDDLQSFTLSRFMPPELMGYSGRAIVIDPDIFALTNIEELLEFDLGGAGIAACLKKDAWDTSVMLLDCNALSHWKISSILDDLRSKKRNYKDIMTLSDEMAALTPLPRIWNDLDTYTSETKMIHMTNRLTQPWKTGLPIDFRRNAMPPMFGIIPREPLYALAGKYASRYKEHPNAEIQNIFFGLLGDALKHGAVTHEEVRTNIEKGYVRSDILTFVD
jgi:hypothetical protein